MKIILIITAITFLISCGPDAGPDIYCPSGEQKITGNTFNDGRCASESNSFANKWLGLCATASFINCVNQYKCSGIVTQDKH
jgi:hypothetical protein